MPMDKKSSQDEMVLESDMVDVADVIAEEPHEGFVTAWRRKLNALMVGRRGLVILFVLGAVLGAGLKVAASQRITMGYQDYTVVSTQAYDLNAMTREVAQKGGSAQAAPSLGGGSCGGQ